MTHPGPVSNSQRTREPWVCSQPVLVSQLQTCHLPASGISEGPREALAFSPSHAFFPPLPCSSCLDESRHHHPETTHAPPSLRQSLTSSVPPFSHAWPVPPAVLSRAAWPPGPGGPPGLWWSDSSCSVAVPTIQPFPAACRLPLPPRLPALPLRAGSLPGRPALTQVGTRLSLGYM